MVADAIAAPPVDNAPVNGPPVANSASGWSSIWVLLMTKELRRGRSRGNGALRGREAAAAASRSSAEGGTYSWEVCEG